MDTKITLSFDEAVIARAKKFAEANNISLSRLMEFLLQKITNNNYPSIDEIPVSSWIKSLAVGPGEYHIKKRKRKDLKNEFYRSRK